MAGTRISERKHTIPAINRALQLVRLLADESGDTTTSGLAKRLGVPRTTCYRILRSLVAGDWVRPIEGGRHELSLGLLPLMQPLGRVEALAAAVGPALDSLCRRTELTAKLSLRQGDCAVTIARCESPQATSVAVRVGASFPLAFGSSGAVLLSPLSRKEIDAILDRAPNECWRFQNRRDVFDRIAAMKSCGYCTDFGSLRPSCHAISAPLLDGRGRVALAMTIIGFPHEVTREGLPGLGKALLAAARVGGKAIARLNLRPLSGERRSA